MPKRLLSFGRLFLKTSVTAGQGSEPTLLSCDAGTRELSATASTPGRARQPPRPARPPPRLRLASRLGSGCALSADAVLGTEDTLELRTKPKAASLAAGSREYPGGRSPDFGRLDFAALAAEAFFKSAETNPKQTNEQKEDKKLSRQQGREHTGREHESGSIIKRPHALIRKHFLTHGEVCWGRGFGDIQEREQQAGRMRTDSEPDCRVAGTGTERTGG